MEKVDRITNMEGMADQIECIKKKIALLDGDRKAYYENSQWTMQKNKEAIQKMRAKNKNLRLILAKNMAGNEKVINDAFRRDDPVRHCAMRGMSGVEAISKLDQQVCETKKQLNNLDHQCRMRKQKLALLQTDYVQMVKDSKTVSESVAGHSEDAQQLRILENRLDKMHLKLNEAHKIRSTYVQILEQQNIERRTWPSQLDALEQGIKEQNEELKRLHIMYKDAQNARTSARNELTKLEQNVIEAMKNRATQLKTYKQQAQEKKEHAESIERRMQQRAITTREDRRSCLVLSGKEHEEKIMTYEEHMSIIKDATGVSDIQEVVQRFLSQTATQEHLEQWRQTNEKTLHRLRDEEEKLRNEFEDLKYSGEAKISSGQKMLEELQERVKSAKAKYSKAKNYVNEISHAMDDIRHGVEHLNSKLVYIKLPKTQIYLQSQISSIAESYVLDLLNVCEKKLLKLLYELTGKDFSDVVKEMEDTEFRVSLETKVPAINTRIKLPRLNNDMTAFEDDDDSADEDEGFCRSYIKTNSQLIVEAKNRKENKSNPSKRKGNK